jgi:hypothetical protein
MATSVTATKNSRSLTVEYEFGAYLQEAVKLFGEDVVFQNAVQSMKISLQALIRRGFDQGLDDAEITARAQQWKPGVSAGRSAADPIQAVLSKWRTLPEDKKAELLRQLKSMAN